MSVASLLSKAQAMGVRLILNGDGVKLRGPADSIMALKPELAAHKLEIVAHLRRAANDATDLSRYPMADGPYTPYVVPMSAQRVASLLADLRTAIGAVADIERWTHQPRFRLKIFDGCFPVRAFGDASKVGGDGGDQPGEERAGRT
ncbi:hypothetical protein [Ralstonia mannitolilytica]|uniref:TubC N-terminal docking domain-related protein n=1 Tax=Ralstonia mannitolilytica TaxID=105219 RepID=UPI001425B542|nr:hypothetical protein [Ralstonia mannitolilytica]